jgi:hypothetical protein
MLNNPSCARGGDKVLLEEGMCGPDVLEGTTKYALKSSGSGPSLADSAFCYCQGLRDNRFNDNAAIQVVNSLGGFRRELKSIRSGEIRRHEVAPVK